MPDEFNATHRCGIAIIGTRALIVECFIMKAFAIFLLKWAVKILKGDIYAFIKDSPDVQNQITKQVELGCADLNLALEKQQLEFNEALEAKVVEYILSNRLLEQARDRYIRESKKYQEMLDEARRTSVMKEIELKLMQLEIDKNK